MKLVFCSDNDIFQYSSFSLALERLAESEFEALIEALQFMQTVNEYGLCLEACQTLSSSIVYNTDTASTKYLYEGVVLAVSKKGTLYVTEVEPLKWIRYL